MSGLWVFITAVVCLSIVGKIVVSIIKASRSGTVSTKAEQRIRELSEDLSSIEQELADARARIEVLEKIVTDDRYHLDQEIRNLA
jgi:peptidoglycan hydrolase CwlO-like protein